MAAIIRVKRRVDEEPQNAFVLNCKKRKVDEVSEAAASNVSKEETSTIVKFAGTVKNPNDLTTQIAKLSKDDARLAVTSKSRVPKNVLKTRNRDEHKHQSQENRFKIVNCYRALDVNGTSDEGAEGSSNITVVDIEKQPAANVDGIATSSSQLQSSQTTQSDNTVVDPQTAESIDNNYVYDLYLPESNEITDFSEENLVANLLSIQPVEELIFGSRRDNGLDDYSSDNMSDDSNDENDYRNDYPDTDDEEHYNNGYGDDLSLGEEDLRRAVYDLDIDDDRALSSDDEDNFIHSLDSEAAGFHGDLDFNNDDASRYGRAYARYKARVTQEITNTDDEDENVELDGGELSF